MDPPGQSEVRVTLPKTPFTVRYGAAKIATKIIEPNRCATFRQRQSGLMSEAVVSQGEPCISGCEENLYPRLFLCGLCRQQVLICRRCDRGQVYCGHDCALEVRRTRQREARRRYQAGERGRQMHAARSRQYRARGRRVTDQGQKLATKPAQQPKPSDAADLAAQPAIINAGVRVTVCHRCGQSVSNLVRLAPICRSRRRLINPYTGRPARRHQQITTDLHRR